MHDRWPSVLELSFELRSSTSIARRRWDGFPRPIRSIAPVRDSYLSVRLCRASLDVAEGGMPSTKGGLDLPLTVVGRRRRPGDFFPGTESAANSVISLRTRNHNTHCPTPPKRTNPVGRACPPNAQRLARLIPAGTARAWPAVTFDNHKRPCFYCASQEPALQAAPRDAGADRCVRPATDRGLVKVWACCNLASWSRTSCSHTCGPVVGGISCVHGLSTCDMCGLA